MDSSWFVALLELDSSTRFFDVINNTGEQEGGKDLHERQRHKDQQSDDQRAQE